MTFSALNIARVLFVTGLGLVVFVWARSGQEAVQPFLGLAFGIWLIWMAIQWLRLTREQMLEYVQSDWDVRYARGLQLAVLALGLVVTGLTVADIARSPNPFTS